MTDLYPEIEPYEQGFLKMDNGNLIYWETCGNPYGKPAVVLHGGPGSRCTPWHRRLFDPSAYLLVLFDQRNCWRSTPHASALDTSLASTTTAHLIADLERLRQHPHEPLVGVQRFMGMHPGARLHRKVSRAGHGHDLMRGHDRTAQGN